MQQLIEDITMISKLEAHETEVEIQNVRVYPVIRRVVEDLNEEAKKNGVHIKMDCIPEMIRMNENHLYEMMKNLIQNGIKYNKANGEVRVEVSRRNQWLKIQVKDTGIGISPEEQTRIFERFYRVDKGRARENGGTGLGLSIVKHIVDYHHGSIMVTSRLGEGSCFQILLPAGS